MTILQDNFLLQDKINDYGFFCNITLEVIISNEDGIKLEHTKDSHWFEDILFGCTYFYRKYKRHRPGGLNIRVTKLDTYLIDTTDIIVVYATIKCLQKILKFEIDSLDINKEGHFIIPK